MASYSNECADQVMNQTNVTENPWPYIECFYGPQTQELPMTILITVINGIIFVTGLLGNIAVCIVIIKQPTLHTATNYYLFNLAVSDVTLLVFGLPNDVAMYWHQYPWPLGQIFCRFRALISEAASYVSVLTVVAFSTERYIAICYPLYLRAISGLQRAVWIIAALWAVSFISALPFAGNTNITHLTYPPNSTDIVPESAMCVMVSQPENFPLTELSSIIFFIVPMVIIAVLYTNMGIAISRASENRLAGKIKGSIHRKNKKNQSNRSIIRMLSLVVLGFFVCWAPFHAQRLMTIYFQGSDLIEEVNYWMYFITGICYYFSSTLNPILYNVMSEKMRFAFKEIFCGVKAKKNTKRSTFRETSNTYVTMQSNSNHHQCSSLPEEDIFLSKDSATMLISQNSRHSNSGKMLIFKAGSIKSKILNDDETGV
ncbi:neuropeptides capa receptor-like [Sitophilus oryzae]|uniref:Neuropeptides capa receptor-like n=1 Tax=Sitophilus oryzae TaxID=7048 RepID=A0A6J2YVJ1_SITOR|nr:neuropeptides capa receptor-like [Sitophilus oryzae]